MGPTPSGDEDRLTDSATEQTSLLKKADHDHNEEHDVAVTGNEPGTVKVALIVGTTFIGVFLGALDMTIMAALAAPIATSFGSLGLISWVASAYIIGTAVCQPLLGRLTDLYGRRPILVVANLLFAIGNLICGLAPGANPGLMIVGRAVAGLGGGGLMAISNFVIFDFVPLRRRGMVQGLSNLVFGVGNGLGGLFGGAINDVWGWRLAFLVQVPLSLVSALLVFFLVAPPSKSADNLKPRLSQVDFPGAFTLTASLILLLLGLNLGGDSLSFTHPLVLGLFALCVLATCAFIWIEVRWVKEPILPVRLMLRRNIAGANLNTWFTLMVVFALLYYVPIWFQVQGRSITEAGLYLVSHSVGVAAGSLTAGFVMQVTGKYVSLGMGLMTTFVLGSGLLLRLHNSSSAWSPMVSLSMVGFGYGGILIVNMLANIASLGQEYQAVITSSNYIFRSTGSTIGVSIASTVFQNNLKSGLRKSLGDDETLTRHVEKIAGDFERIYQLPIEIRHVILSDYTDALRMVFLTCVVLASAAFGCQLFVKQHKLHSNLARE